MMPSSSENIQKIKKDFGIELSKLKGVIEKLKKEVRNEKLNRNKCKDYLFELRSHLKNLGKFEWNLYHSFGLDLEYGKIIESFDPGLKRLGHLAFTDIDSSRVNDAEIRNKIYAFTSDLDNYIVSFKSWPFFIDITGLSKIAELVGEQPGGLDENWATASCYLSAMEIVTNKKRKELELKDDKKKFNEKFKELLKKLEEQGTKISEVERQLQTTFWNIRHKVIHAGYSPTQEELELITNWSKKIIDLII